MENRFSRARTGFIAQKLDQFHQIRRPKFEKHDAAFEFLGNKPDRRSNHDKLALVETAFVKVSQAAPDLCRFPHRVMKIFEMEDRRALV